MEIEPSPPVIAAKKLLHLVKIIFHMLRKGILKSKLLVDLHVMLKRGKIASKAMHNLIENYDYSSLGCRSNDAALSFVSPREYEFSCSNSPVYPTFYAKRKHHHYNYHYRHSHYHKNDDVNVVQKVFDILNNYEMVDSSPLNTLPGFGPSPLVRQLRITDSPFPLKDPDQGNPQVDKAAEEFIKKFYKGLKQEKKMASAAMDSPSPYHKWGR